MKKLTTDVFIERSLKIHGDKYDYSNVEYINGKINDVDGVSINKFDNNDIVRNTFITKIFEKW